MLRCRQSLKFDCFSSSLFIIREYDAEMWHDNPGGKTPIWNRRGCSSEILNLTPEGDQSGRDLSKF